MHEPILCHWVMCSTLMNHRALHWWITELYTDESPSSTLMNHRALHTKSESSSYTHKKVSVDDTLSGRLLTITIGTVDKFLFQKFESEIFDSLLECLQRQINWDLKVNKTGFRPFQDYCKNWSLNPSFCFYRCKKWCCGCCIIQSSNHQKLTKEKRLSKCDVYIFNIYA